MRTAIITSFVIGIAVAFCVVVLVGVLQALDDQQGIDLLSLSHGHVHELLALPSVWSDGLSRLPDLRSFVQLDAVVSVAGVLWLCASVLRRRDKFTWAALGLWGLFGTFVLYGVGYAWLARGQVPIQQCGPTLAWMLITLFYGAATCVLCAGLQLRTRLQELTSMQ